MRVPRKIGIDLDGVLIDHRSHKLSLAQEYGFALEPWQVNENLMAEHVPVEHLEPMKTMLYTHLTVAAPPMDGCLKALASLKAELYIVSARRPNTIRFAQDWLVAHRVYDIVPAERIFFCGSDEEKRGYCDRLNLEMFMDDKASVLDALPGKTLRVLYDEDGVSDRIDTGDRMRVACTWDDFLALAQGREPAPRFAAAEAEPEPGDARLIEDRAEELLAMAEEHGA